MTAVDGPRAGNVALRAEMQRFFWDYTMPITEIQTATGAAGRADAGRVDAARENAALLEALRAESAQVNARRGPAGALPLFAATLFLGALLLFGVQPMVGKALLPALGATPAVWNTCMVFFQAVLLAGYAYAHFLGKWLTPRRQGVVHLAVLALPALVLPIVVATDVAPGAGVDPNLWLLMRLATTVGVPFFVVSTTAPLLQRWFATTGHAAGRDPYFLYAASNAGSLLALLAYPFVMEPLLTLHRQSALWASAYWGFALCVAACVWMVWSVGVGKGRRGVEYAAEEHCSRTSGGTVADTSFVGPTLGRRGLWVLLAAVPSSLMLGVTTHITTDIAAAPLLWVGPLALYLLTFVLVFARRQWIRQEWWVRALPLCVLPLTALLFWDPPELAVGLIVAHLATFFVAAMVCHGRLAALRPAARHLTTFYLCMSLGGVLGGLFNAVVAPVAFSTIVEYPLMLVLACWLARVDGMGQREVVRPRRMGEMGAAGVTPRDASDNGGFSANALAGASRSDADGGWVGLGGSAATALAGASRSDAHGGRVGLGGFAAAALAGASRSDARGTEIQELGFRARDLFMPVGVAGLAILLALVQRAAPGVTALVGLAVCVPMFACFALAGRPARFALGVGALLLVNNYFAGADHGTLERVERNFYGVKRVMTDRTGAYRMLVHGGTNHGAQALTQERAREAVTYYHHTGPIGDVFATLPTAAGKRRIGVIGLGTGSLATYLTPGDTATFYEIDPAVARIAEEPRYFTFLSDCRAGYRIVLGDGRLTIAEAPAHGFDLIVLDAFSSDAIPTHLLTREALATYAEKLAPGGWIAFHVSNNFVDLRPLLAELAADAGLACYGRTDRAVPEALRMIGKTPSVWVVMARRGEELTPLVEKGSWEATKRRAGLALWTDQYSNLTSLMHW